MTTARAHLIDRVMEAGLSEHWATRQVDAFAHQLAEQQRYDAKTREIEGETALAEYGRELADLIDPEASR